MVLTVDDPFVGRKLTESHRAARVQFLRADCDLSAQAKLTAVVEPRRSVDKYRRRIDFVDEACGVGLVVRQDSIAVRGAVCLDMLNGLVQPADDLDAQDQAEPLGIKVVRTGGR